MHIVIQTLGTRGDVDPFVALAQRLLDAGHTVRLAAGAEHEAAAGRVSFVPLSLDVQRLLASPVGSGALGSLRGALRAAREVRPVMRTVLDECWSAARDAEFLVFHPKIIAGPHIAEKLGIPAMVALPIPALTPIGAFPTPLFRWPDLSGPTNRLSHRLLLAASQHAYAGMIDDWRAKVLGLPSMNSVGTSSRAVLGRSIPRLYAFSEALMPWPLDWTDDDHVTGYWFADGEPSSDPPPDVRRFIEEGPKPIYVGFGSMVSGDATARTNMVIEALANACLRGVLGIGWGGLKRTDAPDHVHFVESVQHDWLFPRMEAVVHHGGSGTTHNGLRHGRPTLICPLFGDQPFWGDRIAKLGLGPQPLALRHMTLAKLSDALIDLCGNSAYGPNAAAIQERMAAEDPSAPVRAIERIAQTWRQYRHDQRTSGNR